MATALHRLHMGHLRILRRIEALTGMETAMDEEIARGMNHIPVINQTVKTGHQRTLLLRGLRLTAMAALVFNRHPTARVGWLALGLDL